MADVAGSRRLTRTVCAVACATLAGCSSSGGGQTQAQSERAAVLPAAKSLYGQVNAAGVGWTASITGLYAPCGEDDPLAAGKGGGRLQYTATQLMTPFRRGVALATFGRQMVQALDAAGWDLRPLAVAGSPARWYAGRRGNFDLRLENYYDGQLFGSTATIDLSGSCFDAGSAGQKLTQSPMDDLHEPRPTSTPTPKYS